MADSRLRLRRIRFKDGRGDVEIFRTRTKEQDAAEVSYYVKRAIAGHDDRIAGFAFVAWGPNNASTAEIRCWDNSQIALVQAPDFVRERLMHEVHERWVRRGLKDDGLI